MILPVLLESFQSYLADPRQVLQVKRPCPACKSRSLSRHGSYRRWIYGSARRERVIIFRLRCRPCGLTVTLLPDLLVPYRRYALGVVEAALSALLGGASCRAAAVEASGVELPADVSVTDALLWTRLTPSYQRVHAWLARLTATATPDVQAASEWLVRRVPGGLGAHLVATPLAPVALRSPRAEQRADLTAARLLMRLFATDPDLNPLDHGWLRAWYRFEALVLARSPWRRWPRPPPEPQSS